MIKKRSFGALPLLISFVALLFLVSCGGDRRPLTGVFIDSAVEGLKFTTDSQSGFTDENGSFQYRIGEEVTFSVGSIVLGRVPGDSVITPLTLFDTSDTADPRVINVARLLLTLDSDFDTTGNTTSGADNGIQLDADLETLISNVSLNFEQPASAFLADPEFSNLLNNLPEDKNKQGLAGALSSADITAHLVETIAELNANTAPVIVIATSNQTVTSGTQVLLSASATDDDVIESAKWTQRSPDTPDVVDAVSESSKSVEEELTVTMPTVTGTTEFEFIFTAVDNDGETRTGLVIITVNPNP